MFGFGWVRTHLGVVFNDVFGLFWIFLVRFLEKGTKSANLSNFGVLRHGVGIPRSNIGPRQGVACPRHSAAEWEAWTSLGYAEA